MPTIMGEVRRYFRGCAWSVHVPQGVKEVHLWLPPTVETLTQRLGRAPTVREISDITGVPRARITQALCAGNGFVTASLDSIFGDYDGHQSKVDTYGIEDHGFDKVTQVLTVGPLLATLSVRESTILYLCFFDELTQSQIARKIGRRRCMYHAFLRARWANCAIEPRQRTTIEFGRPAYLGLPAACS